MAKVKITDRDLGWESIKQELEKLRKMSVKVGIVEGHNVSEDGANIAEYAAYNEEGTEHITSRPFIRSWVDNNQEQINRVMDSALNHVVSGQWTAQDAMKRIGEFAQSGIKKNIEKGNFEPNKPSTVQRKKKKREGNKRFRENSPLIDSGDMRNSIRYEVVKK